MDSLSQIALGSSVAYLVGGRQAPRLSLLAGAVVGTLPDLDIIVQYADPLTSTIAHRTWSHSWLAQTAVSPLLAYAASIYLPTLSFKRWWLLIWLCLITHSLLDCFTIYGTGVFWPFSSQTIMWGSIFIIDPAYTLPLLIGVIVAWRNQTNRSATLWVMGGLLASSMYLAWGLFAQQMISERMRAQLDKQAILSTRFFVTPTPFNSLLWRVVAIDEQHYYEGVASVFDADPSISLDPFPRALQSVDGLEKLEKFTEYQRFTHGFYALENQQGALVVKDLRMGITPFLMFQFEFAQAISGRAIAVPPSVASPKLVPLSELKKAFAYILKRVFNQAEQMPALQLPPTNNAS